jgi:hypothetical protein
MLTRIKFSDILNHLMSDTTMRFRRKGDDLCGELGRNSSVTKWKKCPSE